MNINEMKSAIAKFRKADLSMIKDEKLRAKGQKLQAKEKGFTLLELLVVITLIAILATGALVAYENVGESAEAAQAGNTIATLDRAIRTYRAVENVYPNQWDNLLDENGAEMTFTSSAMQNFLGVWDVAASTDLDNNVLEPMFIQSGITEIQQLDAGAVVANNQTPNRMHNESTGNAEEVEIEEDGEFMDSVAVVPNAICNLQGAPGSYPAALFNGTNVTSNTLQNSYGDALESDDCHAVIALGFGGDAAASTTFSNVAIAQSPSYSATTGVPSTAVSQDTHYARYIGLFHAGSYDNDDSEWEFNDTLRLIAIVSTDGKNIDQLVAEANQASAGDDD